MYKLPAIPFWPVLKVLVERYDFKPDWTIGRLFINGVFVCFTVEDEMRKLKVKGETSIPYGVYPLGLRWSPKFSATFNHEMIWIQNVPNFEYVLLHWGNTDDDTDACLIVGDIVGTLKGQAAVLNSKDTYKAVYPFIANHLKSGGKAVIEYKQAKITL
jgi:hypothetical protein